MSRPAPPTPGHPLLDLVCVAVLAILLWLSAHAIGGIARGVNLQPGAGAHGSAAAQPPQQPGA